MLESILGVEFNMAGELRTGRAALLGRAGHDLFRLAMSNPFVLAVRTGAERSGRNSECHIREYAAYH